jgi:hypothetical protein
MIKLYVADREWREKFQVLTEEEVKAIARAMGWSNFVLIKDGGEIIPMEKLPLFSYSSEEEIYWLYPEREREGEEVSYAQCYTDQQIHDLLTEIETKIVKPMRVLNKFYKQQIESWARNIESNLPKKDIAQKKITFQGKEYLCSIENGKFSVKGLPNRWEDMSIEERILYVQLFKEYVYKLCSDLRKLQGVLQKVAMLFEQGCGPWV